MIIRVGGYTQNKVKEIVKCENLNRANDEVKRMKEDGYCGIQVMVICLEKANIPKIFEYLGYEETKQGDRIKYYLLRCY